MALNRMKLVNQAELRRQVGKQAKVSKAFLAALERRLKAVLGEALERLEAQGEDGPKAQGVGPGTLLPEHLEGAVTTRLFPLSQARHESVPEALDAEPED